MIHLLNRGPTSRILVWDIGNVGVQSFPIGPIWPIGQLYPYSTIWEKNVVVILHIYGEIAIFLLFCDHQDTESESPSIKTEKTSKALWDKISIPHNMGEKYCGSYSYLWS